ncbi:MAG: cadmium-translocating P-type ATPase [Chloroflexi bacterium]|nr:cadmium-translocating P-type ATPase [Chloroflexota bacterium]
MNAQPSLPTASEDGASPAELETKVLRIEVLLPGQPPCLDCAQRLRDLLLTRRGIRVAHLNPTQGALTLHYDPQLVSLAQVERMAHQAGAEVRHSFHHDTLAIEGMDCADCALKVEEGVGRLPGVFWSAVNLAAGTLRVEYNPQQVSLDEIVGRVHKLGYGVAERPPDAGPEAQGAPWRIWLQRRQAEATTLAAGLLLLLGAVSRVAPTPPWWGPVFYGLAILVAGAPLARKGWQSLRLARSLDINLLMTIAAVGAMAIGEWAEGAVVVFLFNIGELLESYTTGRARNAIRSLMSLAPAEAARLLPDGQEERVAVGSLAVGDVIVIRPGDRIPMDGLIAEGRSAVDQSAVTGESLPVERGPGAEVYAGSVNGSGALTVRVTRLASDNTIARMVHLVEEAQSQKARSQRFIDRFARVYTPAVVAAALVVALLPPLLGWGAFSQWLYRALVLLVISCPCALVISTPVAVAGAIANAARQGILIKGGVHLEDAARLQAIALDKTGTLTVGRPAVTEVVALNGMPAADVLALAAAVESRSEHPLAQAVVAKAAEWGLPIGAAQEVQALVGRGVQGRVDGVLVTVGSHPHFCETLPHAREVCDAAERLESAGSTALLVSREAEVVGVVGVADALRPEAPTVVQQLGNLGLRPRVMLTGDNAVVAQAVAQQAGLDDYRANLLPEAKVQAVAELAAAHGAVGMVGDGVNDAPALARATLGLAMGAAGTDQALETADVALMGDDLRLIPRLIALSRGAMHIVRQNVAAALLVKFTFLVLALLGRSTLWMAVFADTGVAVLVVLNAMRLLRWGRS